MPIFIGNEMQIIFLEFKNEEQLHILIIYDEYLFYANDDHPII